jgi:hypothetical protein
MPVPANYILRKLFSRDLSSRRFGGPAATRVIIRVTWHIMTLTFATLGAALAKCGFFGRGGAPAG